MPTAISTPNIALIKYWGNRNNELRLPMADSLSITLDSPSVTVMVDHAATFSLQSFDVKGSSKSLKEKDIARLEQHLLLTKNYLRILGQENALPASVRLEIRSNIPQAIGIASSAAVFSAIAEAYGALVDSSTTPPSRKNPLSRKQISVIARLGSGSAARSIFGGFAALRAGEGANIDAACGEQIAPETHWLLHDIIIIPSTEEKKIGSTEGHALAHTSPLFPARVEAIRARRQQECIDAVLARDFEKLRAVTEEDCLDMHAIMESQNPPLRYLTETTHRIVSAIADARHREHIPVLFTMDAGPTVHLFCTEEGFSAVRAFGKAQKECMIIETKIGRGSRLE